MGPLHLGHVSGSFRTALLILFPHSHLTGAVYALRPLRLMVTDSADLYIPHLQTYVCHEATTLQDGSSSRIFLA